jgi:hypothetical protein
MKLDNLQNLIDGLFIKMLQGDDGFGDPFRNLEDAIRSINTERKA